MTGLATYFYPDIFESTRPLDQLTFNGYAVPHFQRVFTAVDRRLAGRYPALPYRKADLTDYARVHDPAYLEALEALSQDRPVAKKPHLNAECHNFWYLLPGYTVSLGGMLEAIDQMRRGWIQRAYVQSLCGHHAYRDWGHGYCLLNPLAAAARYAQQQGFHRIIIVDWDIHHGDGTQALFAHDPTVYCISLHNLLDLYMEKIAGAVQGTTPHGTRLGHCNIPILPGNFEPEDLLEAELDTTWWRGSDSIDALGEALANSPFVPDLLLLFSGYDSHRDDCGRGVTDWGDEEFVRLTRQVLDYAVRHDCPVLSVPGGGYQEAVAVGAAVAHVETLATYRA
jgi:acetoin utilization deacetylase AcuC-like enzyme